MNSTASLTGMEYFSSVSNSSRKIAVALHGMFLGKRYAALADDGKNAKKSSKIKKHNLFPLKYWRDIFPAHRAIVWLHLIFAVLRCTL
jgi:hypothetical protein